MTDNPLLSTDISYSASLGLFQTRELLQSSLANWYADFNLHFPSCAFRASDNPRLMLRVILSASLKAWNFLYSRGVISITIFSMFIPFRCVKGSASFLMRQQNDIDLVLWTSASGISVIFYTLQHKKEKL
jgi:hypothetical protein